MKGFGLGAFVGTLCLGLVLTTAPAPARAAMIGTEQMMSDSTRAADFDTVSRFMSRAEVAAQFEQLGVDPVEAQRRVASLSDEELSRLAQNIREQPAGGDGLFVVLGIVFLVLIILELVGVTHIFSAI